MKVGLKKLKSLHGLPASDSRFISFFISDEQFNRSLVQICITSSSQSTSRFISSASPVMSRLTSSWMTFMIMGRTGSPDLSRYIFLVSHFKVFLFILCGRLSWLPVSFLLHVKYTLSYCTGIIIWRITWRTRRLDYDVAMTFILNNN